MSSLYCLLPIVVFPPAFVSEKQPVLWSHTKLDSDLALACLHYMTLEKLHSIPVPQFLYKIGFNQYLLYEVVIKNKPQIRQAHHKVVHQVVKEWCLEKKKEHKHFSQEKSLHGKRSA